VIQHHPDRSCPHFGGKLVRGLAHNGSFYSRVGASDNPGAVQFTCKRTLRERWRQVVTEGLTGQAFYLATIDEGISVPELTRMRERNVIVVVPEAIKSSYYLTQLNVISFENFFDHHLDPALGRWKANSVI
jgi:hypothetical protein